VSYGKIVFGTDGSPTASNAGRVAAKVAKATTSRLVAVSAYHSPVGVEEVLAKALDAAETSGMRRARLESISRQGAPAETVAEIAEELDAGLIVVSRGVSQKYPLSEVSRRLSHHTPCDLLIVSTREHDPETPYAHILIASDGSATADRAARKGFDLAQSLDAKVTLVFVGHPATGDLVMQDTIAVYGEGVPTDVQLRSGDPGDEILAAARETDADLVVVGNKGMTGAKGFLLGSVPEKVIEGADRDVLMCRTVMQIVSELQPGEGGVIERRGEKIAAYVDRANELHLMSARCTHLGCTVAWNPGEMTFDCPCHGSRFGPLGEVVNGPAARALPPA
jgi:nucleotide-binding universal stress UspA family protein/nitrite reductase/ring-hydroxylating ferredoxin subunit